MIDGSYRFKVGDFDCVSISDGSADYPPKNLFANVPLEKLEMILRERDLPTDHVTTPYTFLFVDTGDHRVLVDMGAGTLGPNTGKLLHNMEAAGIEPAAVDTVIVTHAHPDHVGGTLDGAGKLVYANARYFIFKREWDFWFSETATTMASERHVEIARNNLEPLRDWVHCLDREAEIVPGIRTIAAPGHTPGHMVLAISSGGEQLLHITDTVLYPLHLEHPDWVPIFDILPEEAKASKQKVFNLAADEQALVIGMHFPPFPSLGHVTKQGQGWQWRPIETG